jgi:hypothetical protein
MMGGIYYNPFSICNVDVPCALTRLVISSVVTLQG